MYVGRPLAYPAYDTDTETESSLSDDGGDPGASDDDEGVDPRQNALLSPCLSDRRVQEALVSVTPHCEEWPARRRPDSEVIRAYRQREQDRARWREHHRRCANRLAAWSRARSPKQPRVNPPPKTRRRSNESETEEEPEQRASSRSPGLSVAEVMRLTNTDKNGAKGTSKSAPKSPAGAALTDMEERKSVVSARSAVSGGARWRRLQAVDSENTMHFVFSDEVERAFDAIDRGVSEAPMNIPPSLIIPRHRRRIDNKKPRVHHSTPSNYDAIRKSRQEVSAPPAAEPPPAPLLRKGSSSLSIRDGGPPSVMGEATVEPLAIQQQQKRPSINTSEIGSSADKRRSSHLSSDILTVARPSRGSLTPSELGRARTAPSVLGAAGPEGRPSLVPSGQPLLRATTHTFRPFVRPKIKLDMLPQIYKDLIFIGEIRKDSVYHRRKAETPVPSVTVTFS